MDDILYGQKSDGTLAPLFSDYLRHVIIGVTEKLEDYTLTQKMPESLDLEVPDLFPNREWNRLVEAIQNVFLANDCSPPSITRYQMTPLPLIEKKRRIMRGFPVAKDI